MYWDAKPIIYRNIYFLINENTTTCSSFPFVINNGLLIWLNTQNSLSFPPPSADGVHLEEQNKNGLLRCESLYFCTAPGILLMVSEVIFFSLKNPPMHSVLAFLAAIAPFLSLWPHALCRGRRPRWRGRRSQGQGRCGACASWQGGDGRGWRRTRGSCLHPWTNFTLHGLRSYRELHPQTTLREDSPNEKRLCTA